MFDIHTTDFNMMNTPYGKDICAELVEAFRAQSLDSKTVTLKSVKASDNTQVSDLGQTENVLVYHPDGIPNTTWELMMI